MVCEREGEREREGGRERVVSEVLIMLIELVWPEF